MARALSDAVTRESELDEELKRLKKQLADTVAGKDKTIGHLQGMYRVANTHNRTPIRTSTVTSPDPSNTPFNTLYATIPCTTEVLGHKDEEEIVALKQRLSESVAQNEAIMVCDDYDGYLPGPVVFDSLTTCNLSKTLCTCALSYITFPLPILLPSLRLRAKSLPNALRSLRRWP